MSAARLLSSAMVFGGFMLFGALDRLRRRQQLNELRSLCADISEAESRLRLLKPQLAELIRPEAERGEAYGFWLTLLHELERGGSPYEAFCAAEPLLKSENANLILGELFKGIGSSDTETELKRLEFARERLNRAADEAEETYAKSAKLKSSIAVLMGLAAALILL